jgi:hypothetical protein
VPNPVSRQTGVLSWFNTSEAVAISAVDPAKTFVQAQYRGNEAGMDRQTFSVELTSGTSIQFERIDRNGATEIEWEVIEFDDAGLSVQHVAGLAIGANAITAVDLSRAVPISSGNTSLAGDDRVRNYVELELTAVDELTARYRTAWPVAGVIAQVLELPAADVASLQAVSAAAVPFAITITSVDETKTLTFGTGYVDGFDAINNNGHGQLDLASATSLEAVRSDGSGTAITLDYTAYILELTGSDVQRVAATFAATDLALTAALSAVDASTVSVFAGGWAGHIRWKQGDSLTTSANSEGAFTATLNGTTGVDFERGIAGTTGGSSSPLAQVVEWGVTAAGGLVSWNDDGASVAFDLIGGTVTAGTANLDGADSPVAAGGNLSSAAGGPTALLGATPTGLELFLVVEAFAGTGSGAATGTALWSIDDGSLTIAFDGTSVHAEYSGTGPTLSASQAVALGTGVHVVRVALAMPTLTLQVDALAAVTDTDGGSGFAALPGTERFHVGGNRTASTDTTATFDGMHAWLFDAELGAADRSQMYDYLAASYPSVAVP